jgi:hypothetical protein
MELTIIQIKVDLGGKMEIINKKTLQKHEVTNNELSLLLKYGYLNEENGGFYYEDKNRNKIMLLLKADRTDKVNQVYALREVIDELHDVYAKNYFESDTIKVNHLFLKMRKLKNLYDTIVSEGFKKE